VTVDSSMTSGFHAHFHDWRLSPPVTLAMVLVALIYLRGWIRLREVLIKSSGSSVHPRVPLGLRLRPTLNQSLSKSDIPALLSPWRLVAFCCGLFFFWSVVGSPLSMLDHDLLTVHMINHLVLMVVVAPLTLAGAPGLLLSQGLPEKFGRAIHNSVLDSAPAQRLLRLLKHPVFCWLCATATVIGWHLPAIFQLAMRSRWWHDAEYASFMVAGLLFWLPVVQPVSSVREPPRWSTPLYLFLATLPCDVLSAFLVFCGRVVYPSYMSAPWLFNLSPIQDQQCAGALMWVSVTLAYLLPAVVITLQILSPHGMHSQPPAQGTWQRLTPPLPRCSPE